MSKTPKSQNPEPTAAEIEAVPAPATESAATAPKPSVGRMVHYRLSQQEADEINTLRKQAWTDVRSKTSNRNTKPARQGNDVVEGTVCAAIVTAVWSDNCVNLQVILDGNDSLWATSRSAGDQPGCWSWPERV